MEKFKFLGLFLFVMGVGFYVGSRDGGYASHWFSNGNLRTPANETAVKVNDTFKLGELKTGRDRAFKIYSFLERPNENICEVFSDVAQFKFTLSTNSASSGEPARIVSTVNCKESGSAALFMSSFCQYYTSDGYVESSIDDYSKDFEFENTKFSFLNILDGFPSEWYVENLDVQFKYLDNAPLFGIKPLQRDIAASGDKFVIDCNSF